MNPGSKEMQNFQGGKSKNLEKQNRGDWYLSFNSKKGKKQRNEQL